MPLPLLKIPELITYRWKAFDAVVRHLKKDDILAGVIRNWATWEGIDPELDVSLPTENQCPWIRLSPYAAQQEAGAVDIDHAPLVIMIEMAIEGTRARDLMDLWEVVEARVSSYATTVDGQQFNQDLQNNYRVHRTQVTMPTSGFLAAASPAQVGMLYARGSFHMWLDIPR